MKLGQKKEGRRVCFGGLANGWFFFHTGLTAHRMQGREELGKEMQKGGEGMCEMGNKRVAFVTEGSMFHNNRCCWEAGRPQPPMESVK